MSAQDVPGAAGNRPGPSPTAGDPLPDLIAAARALIVPDQRRLLGITGAPGAGKSLLAERVVAALGTDAVLVDMDGFQLAGAELHRLGRHERKGAPATFDAAGYVALLRRLVERVDPVVYAPRFDRGLEEPIGSAVPVPRAVPLIVTEGNYLLLDEPAWAPVRELLDTCWFVAPPEELRMTRLIARHMAFGRDAAAAQDRARGSDAANAAVVTASRDRADRIVVVPELPELLIGFG